MFRVHVFEALCKGCKYCVAMCPTKVFIISEQLHSSGYFPAKAMYQEKCVGCGLCERICPDFALAVEKLD